MDIRQLLEATIYRYQSEWTFDEHPVLFVQGRQSRQTKGSFPYEVYELAYGLDLLGINCPKRWKSSFATTDPKRSTYVGSGLDTPGLRRIEIPNNIPVGAVIDDFNNVSLESVSVHVHKTSRFVVDELSETHPDIVEQWRQWANSVLVIYRRAHELSDEGYQQYVDLMKRYDVLMADKVIKPHWVSDEILEHGTLEKSIAANTKRLLDSGKIAVFDSVGAVPSGKNYEVWFEGDYQAIKIDAQVDEIA